MKAVLYKVLLCALLRFVIVSCTEVIVNTNNGAIRGQESVDENGNIYYDFRGIPYGEAPVGNLRFKPPVPKLPWDGTILDVTKDGLPCPQFPLLTNQLETNEDNCLTLNVYTPKLPSDGDSAKLDVVFHIHGGGFALGAGGWMYHPARFMQKDKSVVLVSLTYRVAALGFLSTLNEKSPGNYGLLDQVEALRWVRNNIHRFSGDPTKVTIFGESAGGASVIHQMLSPLTKGLFHRAIAMSGTALNPWAFQTDPTYWTKFLAHRLNCPETDINVMFDCLKNKSSSDLIENDGTFDFGILHMRLIPTLDHHFILDSPYNIISNRQYHDVPLMIGVTRDEGSLWFRVGRADPNADFSDEEIQQCLERLFSTVTNVDKATKRIKEKYFSDFTSRKSKDVYKHLGKLVTDYLFHKYHYQTVQLMVDGGSTVYAYSYDYVTNNDDAIKQMYKLDSSEEIGACHGSDLVNFFSNPMLMKSLEGKDLEVKEKVQKLFFNFVRTGNPNHDDVEVEWPQARSNQLNVYHLDTESKVTVYDPAKDDLYRFWVEEVPEILGHKHLKSSFDYEKDEL